MAAKDSGSLGTISTSNPQITIDEFTFVLIQIVNFNPRYSEILEIHSYKSSDPELEPTKFWVYRSNSELGFWRLCVNSDDYKVGLWYKGIDYVQSTFIHIQLQVFINENISRIVKKTIYNRVTNEPKNICFTLCPSKEMAIAQINNESRIISEEPFLTINNYDNEEKTSKPIGCGRIPKGTKNSIVNSILQNFSIELKEQYNINDLTFISRLDFDFENILKSEGEIYSIELIRKTPDPSLESNNIIIYFMKTKLIQKPQSIQNGDKLKENITRICGKPFHVFPFFITSRYGTITNLGLFNKYIPSGLFICKLFDYHMYPYEQCTVEESANEQCNGVYSYIGKRYSNLFPIEEAVSRLSQSCSVDSGTIEEEGVKEASVLPEEDIKKEASVLPEEERVKEASVLPEENNKKEVSFLLPSQPEEALVLPLSLPKEDDKKEELVLPPPPLPAASGPAASGPRPQTLASSQSSCDEGDNDMGMCSTMGGNKFKKTNRKQKKVLKKTNKKQKKVLKKTNKKQKPILRKTNRRFKTKKNKF
jgi:hypothetical protein